MFSNKTDVFQKQLNIFAQSFQAADWYQYDSWRLRCAEFADKIFIFAVENWNL